MKCLASTRAFYARSGRYFPGRVFNEHFAGRRKRYVPPARVYVFAGFIFFLTFALLGGGSFQEGFQNGWGDAGENETSQQEEVPIEARAAAAADTSVQVAHDRLHSAAPGSLEAKFRAAEDEVGQIFVQRLSVIFFLAVPLLALTLTARGTELLPAAINGTVGSIAGWTFLVSVGAYLVAAMRRVYAQVWWKTTLKALLAVAGYVAIFVLVAVAVVAGSTVLFY